MQASGPTSVRHPRSGVRSPASRPTDRMAFESSRQGGTACSCGDGLCTGGSSRQALAVTLRVHPLFSVPLVCSAPVLRGRGFLRHLHHRNFDIASGTCCIAFAGGGSGGHLTPAIAIAEELLERRPSLRILFFVSTRAVDRRILNASNLVAMANFTVIPQQVESGNVARSHPLRFLRGLAGSIRLCREHMRQENCGFLLGLGGFASLPAVVANRRLRRPLALLETNCVPGRANRILNRRADVTFTGWPLEARFAER